MPENPTSIFQLDEFKEYAGAWSARQTNLAYRKAYYTGEVYASIRDRFMALGQLSAMLGPRLYRGTKALFLPLQRAVHVDAGIIPGGWQLAPEQAEVYGPAMRQILAWSDWAVDGVLYVHYGAMCGLAGLKVADVRQAGRVLIKPLDPMGFMLSHASQYDPTPAIAFVVEERRDLSGKPYEYAEVITAEAIRTFRAGAPYGYDGRPAEYQNAQGQIPIVEIKHINSGHVLGESTAQAAFPLLDEVNELASYLADIIKKHSEAQWAIAGAEPSDLVKSGDNVWFMPKDATAQALVAGIDIKGVLEFINTIRSEVHGALPELAFDDIRNKTQIATATLEIQLMELVLKIKRARPNYDHGLADALRLAGRAAGGMGLRELAALDDEALSFDASRDILPIDKLTAMQIEQAALSLEQQRALVAPGEGN